MKKAFIFILCIFYTFISLGGTVFVHQCSHQTFLSLYSELAKDHCPLCDDSHDHKSCKLPDSAENKGCAEDSCKDLEIKIDQPKETITTATNLFSVVSPAVLPRLWVDFTNYFTLQDEKITYDEAPLLYSNSCPPPYLLHCIFII